MSRSSGEWPSGRAAAIIRRYTRLAELAAEREPPWTLEKWSRLVSRQHREILRAGATTAAQSLGRALRGNRDE